MPIPILTAFKGIAVYVLALIRFSYRRAIVGLAAVGSISTAFAGDGIFGTKTSPISTTGADTNMGAMPIAKMFVALLVVLALLKWFMPLLLKKFNRRGVVSGQGISVHETVAIGPGNVYVVEVRGKSLLIGATPSSITCLADLSTSKETSLPTFQELIDDAMPQPMTRQKVAMDDLLGQLERLKTFDS